MVRIRLRRVGLKKQPSYRVVVIDQRNARNGSFIEIIGNHNARTRPDTDNIDEARALYWLSKGAQPTDAVERILKRTGTWARYERLRKGETLESLVAEAEAAKAAADKQDVRTSFPSPASGKGAQSTAASEEA